MCILKRPFDGGNDKEVKKKIKAYSSERFEPEQPDSEVYSENLKVIIGYMLAADPDSRADLEYLFTHPPMKEAIAEIKESKKKEKEEKKSKEEPLSNLGKGPAADELKQA